MEHAADNMYRNNLQQCSHKKQRMCCGCVSATENDAPMVTVPRVNFPSEIIENVFYLHPSVFCVLHHLRVVHFLFELDFCSLLAWQLPAFSCRLC